MAQALFLDEACVRQLVTMEDALAAVEEVFGEQGRGRVVNVPRVRAPVKGGTLRITAPETDPSATQAQIAASTTSSGPTSSTGAARCSTRRTPVPTIRIWMGRRWFSTWVHPTLQPMGCCDCFWNWMVK